MRLNKECFIATKYICMQKNIQHNKDERRHLFRKIYLSHSKTFSNPFEPFQIKWEVYFSKELCVLAFIVSRYDSVSPASSQTQTLQIKRGEYFSKEVFLCLPSCILILRRFPSCVWHWCCVVVMCKWLYNIGSSALVRQLV